MFRTGCNHHNCQRSDSDDDDSDSSSYYYYFNHHQSSHPRSTFMRKPSPPRKCQPLVEHLKVTLADLYVGKTFDVSVQRKVECKTCKGLKKNRTSKCISCHGRGKYIAQGEKSQRNKTGKFLKTCVRCNGKGVSTPEQCKTCSANKFFTEKHVIRVKLHHGIRDGEKMCFEKQGNEEIWMQAGDVIVVIHLEKHEIFERKGNDLIMEKPIGIAEALYATSTIIEHLDGRKLVIKRDYVIEPGTIHKLPSEGMRVGRSHGDLYIVYKINFPSKYFFEDQTRYTELHEALTFNQAKEEPLGEEVTLEEFDKRRYQNTKRQNRQESYESDDDCCDDRRGFVPECAHQ